MSSEERKKILQMVEGGKISAEEALLLMAALDDGNLNEKAAEAEGKALGGGAASGSERGDVAEFDQIKARTRRWALIPLGLGIAITGLSVWAMYFIRQSAGMNFWFYCMILPLMGGVLLIVLGGGGLASRWMYVDVKREDANEGPRHIAFAFPLPLGFLGWFFDTFGHHFKRMRRGRAEGIVQVIRAVRDTNEPFMMQVDDEDDRVQILIS